MRDVKINPGDEYLMPSVTVTLDAVEVQAIFSALYARNQEHRERVRAMDDPHPNALASVDDGLRQDGEWSLLEDQVGDLFWKWVNQANA